MYGAEAEENTQEPNSRHSGLEKTAFWLAVIIAVLYGLYTIAMPFAALLALIFAAGAYGIYRRRAWDAFGCGLLLTVAALNYWLRVENPGVSFAVAIAGSAFELALAGVFFLAGLEFRRRGMAGASIPWIALCVALLAFVLMFRSFVIPSGSMENTLLVGDEVLARVSPRGREERGDVIAFRFPPDPRQLSCKRVIGIEGDRLSIRNKILFLNGSQAHESYVQHLKGAADAYRDFFPSEPTVRLYPAGLAMLEHNVVNGEIVVPPGELFVLGDNRDRSLDSRYFGFVNQRDVIGKIEMIYYSTPSQTSQTDGRKPLTTIADARWGRIFQRVR